MDDFAPIDANGVRYGHHVRQRNLWRLDPLGQTQPPILVLADALRHEQAVEAALIHQQEPHIQCNDLLRRACKRAAEVRQSLDQLVAESERLGLYDTDGGGA